MVDAPVQNAGDDTIQGEVNLLSSLLPFEVVPGNRAEEDGHGGRWRTNERANE